MKILTLVDFDVMDEELKKSLIIKASESADVLQKYAFEYVKKRMIGVGLGEHFQCYLEDHDWPMRVPEDVCTSEWLEDVTPDQYQILIDFYFDPEESHNEGVAVLFDINDAEVI